MKKILYLSFLIFIFVFSINLAKADTLKAQVTKEYVPNGFFGSWAVVSKIINTNAPLLFNPESKDIWTLSGYSNVLFLENLQSGARSQIILKEQAKNNVLKFEREKIVNNSKTKKTIYKETVEFTLLGDNFSGFDNFIVENWQEGKLIKKSSAKYKVSGVKISGERPKS